MPTTPRPNRVINRARYARTSGNMLVGGRDPWDPNAGINPGDQPPIWWYGTDSGGGAMPIGPNGPFSQGLAEAVPTVLRATALIVNPIAQSPLTVQEQAAFGEPAPVPRWLQDPMLLRDDARFTQDVYPAVTKLPRSAFWADFIRSALWWGVGAFLCQEDESGQPLAGTLRLVNPHMLSTERESGSLRWVLGADGAYEDRAVFTRDGYLSLGSTTYRIVTLRNPNSTVDAEGYSKGVFAQSPGAFGLAAQVDSYMSGQFRSGIPAGYLKVETPGLTQPQADDLKGKWMQHHGNDRRSIAVLNATTTFVPLSLSPVDAALGEVKRLNVADVAFAFAIDPGMLGASLNNSSTYANARDYFRQHRDLGLGMWIAGFQETLSALLSGSQGVRVDLDSFTRAEPAERYAAYKVAIDAGILTVEEVRVIEGLPEMETPAPPPVSAPEPVPVPPPGPEPIPAPPTPASVRGRPPALRR